jgi:hypothetical protein
MTQTFKKLCSMVILTVLCVAGAATGVSAADDAQLSASIDGSNPAQSVLVLKNISRAACQVADTATGTTAITRVIQDGTAITPLPMEVSFEEGLDRALVGQLKTLAPGDSVTIPLRATKSGDIVGLQSVTWSPDGGSLGLLYEVKPNKPLQIELNYSVPIDSPTDAPMCAGVQASTIDDSDSWLPQFMMGIGILGGIAAVLFVWLVVVKRHKKTPAGVAMIVMASSVAVFGVMSQPVSARMTVPSSVQSNWDTCAATLRANSDITGPILAIIDNPAINIIIDPVDRGGAEMLAWPDGSYHIEWNVNVNHPYQGTGGTADACTSIYHELYHILDMENGTFSRDDCAGSGIETKEVMATRAQNLLRARLGMPQRSHYGDRPLPAGDCRATPPPPSCRSVSCGRSVGEPHLATYDGHRYDFQAAGEFVLTRAKNASLEVQVRQQQWQDSRWVAINTAVVVKTTNHSIEVAPDGYILSIMIDGKKQPIETKTLSDGDTVTVLLGGRRIDVATKDGSMVSLYGLGNYGVDVEVDPSETLRGTLEGLLGNDDGDTKNDLRLQGSDTTIEPNFGQLYPAYADSWRVTDKTSHFTYSSGKTTASYTNRAFPYERAEPASLAGYKAAEELCRRMGVRNTQSLAECAMDVAITGRSEFARSAARHQTTVAGATDDAAVYTLKANAPGDTAKVTFTAKKDEKVFVDVFSSTYPANCGALTLRDSADTVLGSGCIINGSGFIDATLLPAEGTYSLQLRADEASAGEARIRLYRIANQTGGVTINGDAVTARITKPGVQARFSFHATAGQRLFVSTSNVSLPSQCSPLSVVGSGGQTIGSGCLINAKGSIDTMIVPESGEYTLLVDPGDIAMGNVTLSVTTSQVLSKTISIGESTKLAFIKPGDEAAVQFAGTAGQRVYVEVFDNTLPAQCGGFGMKMPNGEKIDGCIINKTSSLQEQGVVLPVSGVYTIFVDPSDANVGSLSLRVRR